MPEWIDADEARKRMAADELIDRFDAADVLDMHHELFRRRVKANAWGDNTPEILLSRLRRGPPSWLFRKSDIEIVAILIRGA